jgi:O-antigen/teichoic acid export membrane protein
VEPLQQLPPEPPARNSAPRDHFRTDHLKVDLGKRTARGGAVTLLSQALRFVLSTAGTVILARLLTPADYGLIGMVAVVLGFTSMFKDLGLSAATVQRSEVTEKQVSTLFWVNVVLSIAVMMLAIALSPLVAWFFREPRLKSITMVFGPGFFLGGLAVQHEALLKRQMRFVALTVSEIVSICAGLVMAISLALYGAHYWALVFNQLATGLVYLVAVWILCDWRPGWPARYAGVRSMIAFGGNLTGFSVVNYFARNLDNLLIGKVWGSQQLGLYAKAYQLLLLPIDQINTPIAAVAVPALSRLTDAPERYRLAYLRILEKIAILTMPAMAFMVATSDWIVAIVLGPQWTGAARIFALLGISGMIQPVANTTGWLFISQGRTSDMLRWGLMGSGIIVLAIVTGLAWGAVGVAAAYSVVFLCVVTPLLFWFVGRHGPVRSRDFYHSITSASASAVGVLVVVLAIRQALPTMAPAIGLVLSFVAAAAVSLLILLVLPSGRRALWDFKMSVLLLTTRKEAAGQD